MGPKKDRRAVRRIEVPIDSVPEFELGDTAADIQLRREDREAREREEARREEARAKESHSQEEEHPEKRPRTE